MYGDPALLIPEIFNPPVEKKYEVGVIVRWPEADWKACKIDPSVKVIDFGTKKIEQTLSDILSCKRILSSSLHGVILADAYNIPSAWLSSETPKGLEHKYFDYFLSVDKVQRAQSFNFNRPLTRASDLLKEIDFDDKEIHYDPMPLLKACPFINEL